MYGKFFKCAFTGSMFGAGPVVWATWAYVIANAKDSYVEISPRHVAAVLGTTPDEVKKAVDYLCAPDPESKNKDHDGKRMIKEGESQYYIVSFAHYRSIHNDEERKEYNRDHKRKERNMKKGRPPLVNDMSMTVNDSQ